MHMFFFWVRWVFKCSCGFKFAVRNLFLNASWPFWPILKMLFAAPPYDLNDFSNSNSPMFKKVRPTCSRFLLNFLYTVNNWKFLINVPLKCTIDGFVRILIVSLQMIPKASFWSNIGQHVVFYKIFFSFSK